MMYRSLILEKDVKLKKILKNAQLLCIEQKYRYRYIYRRSVAEWCKKFSILLTKPARLNWTRKLCERK